MLVLQTLFYSWLIYFLFICFGIEKFTIKNLIINFLPITFKRYWFMSVFIILYVFTPYINKLLNSLSRKEFIIFIWIGIILFSILKTFTMQDFYSNELIQFIMLYSIGAYLKKYKDNFFSKRKNVLIALTISSLLLIGSVVVLDLVGTKIAFAGQKYIFLIEHLS